MPSLNHDLTELNEDKVLSKRVPTSAVMTMQMTLPGNNILATGEHVVGYLEGNITITKVALIVKEGFDGTTPIVSLVDVQGGVTEAWLSDEVISSPVVAESTLTAATAAGKQDPFYRSSKSEWLATIVTGDSTVGELAFLIDYVQMDAEPGKHS